MRDRVRSRGLGDVYKRQARDSVYTVWKELTDPNAFQPDLPLSFRDAYSLVLRKAGYLGKDEQIALANRLRLSLIHI